MSNSMKNAIKAGRVPRYSFARNKDGSMETVSSFAGKKQLRQRKDGTFQVVARQKRTWRLVSTQALADKEEAKNETA